MGEYNIVYFWTLVFPLATMLSVTMAGYLSMKTKYIKCMLKYNKEFKNSKKGRKYAEKIVRRDKMMDVCRYKDMD